jgi:CAAX protease family protein
VTTLTAPLYHGYTALDLVIVAFVVFAMPAMSIMTGRELARRADESGLVSRYIRIILRGWLYGVAVVAAWWVQGRPFGALGLAPHLNVWDDAGFALALLIALARAVQCRALAGASSEKIEQAMKAVHGIKITPNTKRELALFMLMSLSGGAWEELVYRGFLIWFFVSLTGLLGAAVISALIFGLAHLYQGVQGFVATTGVGLVFAALYLLTGSLWWLIVVHAVMDIGGGITTFEIKRVAARRGLA